MPKPQKKRRPLVHRIIAQHPTRPVTLGPMLQRKRPTVPAIHDKKRRWMAWRTPEFVFWVEGTPIPQSRPQVFTRGPRAGVKTDSHTTYTFKHHVRMACGLRMQEEPPKWHPEDRLPMRVAIELLLPRPQSKDAPQSAHAANERHFTAVAAALAGENENDKRRRYWKSLCEQGGENTMGWHTGEADVDNFAKAVMDALAVAPDSLDCGEQEPMLWLDDGLVNELVVRKWYARPEHGERTGAFVEVFGILDRPNVVTVPNGECIELPQLFLSEGERWRYHCKHTGLTERTVSQLYGITLKEARGWMTNRPFRVRPVIDMVDLTPGEWVHEVRKRLGMSIDVLAELAWTSGRVVRSVEADKGEFDAWYLVEVLKRWLRTNNTVEARDVRASMEREALYRTRLAGSGVNLIEAARD